MTDPVRQYTLLWVHVTNEVMLELAKPNPSEEGAGFDVSMCDQLPLGHMMLITAKGRAMIYGMEVPNDIQT